MPDHNYQVKIVLNNLNLVKKFSQIVRSESGFELLDPNDHQKTDLLIYELGEKPEKDLDLLQTLIQQQGMEEIFLTAESADSGTLMQCSSERFDRFQNPPREGLQQKQCRDNKYQQEGHLQGL